jgi:integrase
VKRLDPAIWRGRWVVDLRAQGFGNRRVLAPATVSREEAVHRAYGLLSKLRGEAAAEPAQRTLFEETAPAFVGKLLDRWIAEHRTEREGTKRYLATYVRLVRGDLASYQLAAFAPPEGNGRLSSYVAELQGRGLSGRTIRNRLSIIEQALRFAAERGWLQFPPLHPTLPPKAPPIFRWITEAMFRALRADLFKGVAVSMMRRLLIADDRELAIYTEKRRVYLSWLFYTGCHHHDADHATTDWLFLDGRSYIRHNNKSSSVVPDEQFEMPDPLYDDLRALEAVLGRELQPAESFTGGPWPECARAMQKAAARLEFPHGANPSILRRSFAREMLLKGYSVREVSDRMGHADERMVKEIYTRTPRATGTPRSRWHRLPPGGELDVNSGMARVLKLQSPEVLE